MSAPLVLALVADAGAAAALAAGFEEEGVPLTVSAAAGSPDGSAQSAEVLALKAARAALLGIGIGGDGERLVLMLTGAPGRPYLEAPVAAARAFGQDAARVLARRPLRGLPLG
jgi:hypothetical protein